MAKGDRQAMAKYNEQQVRQLTRLIEVTRTNLPKSERQKVMNMITIDAHSRDIVGNIVEGGSDKQDCFLWMCQLRSYWDSSINDCRIRICDASFPYGYEYLGNGPRLVITPLTGATSVAAAASPSIAGMGRQHRAHV
jgi:dynein heavy chain